MRSCECGHLQGCTGAPRTAPCHTCLKRPIAGARAAVVAVVVLVFDLHARQKRICDGLGVPISAVNLRRAGRLLCCLRLGIPGYLQFTCTRLRQAVSRVSIR